MIKQLALSLAAGGLLLSAGCSVAQAPENLLSVDYTPAGIGMEADLPGPNADVDLTAIAASYEFLPLGENGNVVIGYAFRDNKLDTVSSPSISFHVAKVGPRWHFDIDDGFTWFIGPNIGVAFEPDFDTPGLGYNTSLYLDVEGGVRYWFNEQFGVQAGANYSSVRLQGNPATLDTDIDGGSVTLGAFVDF